MPKFHGSYFFDAAGGDVISGNGYGFTSIYGHLFGDEGFSIDHIGPMWIDMANYGMYMWSTAAGR